eukprot:1181038-Prorocentrum_minimum.AAC.1
MEVSSSPPTYTVRSSGQHSICDWHRARALVTSRRRSPRSHARTAASSSLSSARSFPPSAPSPPSFPPGCTCSIRPRFFYSAATPRARSLPLRAPLPPVTFGHTGRRFRPSHSVTQGADSARHIRSHRAPIPPVTFGQTGRRFRPSHSVTHAPAPRPRPSA